MSQTMLVKLIIIMNCKDLNHFFFFLACSNFANLLVLVKNISLLAMDTNSLMSTNDI